MARWLPISMLMAAAIVLAPATAPPPARAAQAAQGFRFESVNSIEEMHAQVNAAFRVGASRDDLRRHFVAEGGATRIAHPSRAGVEKYIYDIDLCGYYVWRWNISANFDSQDRVRQIYVNGEPVLAGGDADPDYRPAAAAPNQRSSILRMSRPRPEAHRGESSLGYVLFDGDSNAATIDDQRLVGAGPSRPHPAEMGHMRGYEVNPWRSIFDPDPAARIVPYSGDCAAAEAAYARKSAPVR